MEGKVKPGPLFSAGRRSPTVTDRPEASVGPFVLVLLLWLHLRLFFHVDLEQFPRLAPLPLPDAGCRRGGGHYAEATAAPGAPRPRPGLCPHLHAFCLPEGPPRGSHDLRTSFCTFPSAASHTVAFSLILVATPASYSPQSDLFPPNSPPKAHTDP